MGNFAQPQGGQMMNQQAPMSPFLSALLNAYAPQMQAQMQRRQMNQFGQEPGMDALSQMRYQQQTPGDFSGNAGKTTPFQAPAMAAVDPMAVRRFQDLMAGPVGAAERGNITNWQQALALQALRPGGSYGQEDYQSPEVQSLLFQALGPQGLTAAMTAGMEGRYDMPQSQNYWNQIGSQWGGNQNPPGVMVPGGGYPVQPPMTVGGGLTPTPPHMPGMEATVGQMAPTIGKPPNPLQQGVMQMQPAATMNTMPNPMDKVLGGTAGMDNPFRPKRNSWGVL